MMPPFGVLRKARPYGCTTLFRLRKQPHNALKWCISMKKYVLVPWKEIPKMIENGEIKTKPSKVSYSEAKYTLKGRHGARYSWRKIPQDLWQRVQDPKQANLVNLWAHRYFEQQVELAFLRDAYEKLWDIAFEAGVIKFDGKPCEQCGSTNTQDRGGRHITHEGSFIEAWRDCYDCGHNEYRGDRF